VKRVTIPKPDGSELPLGIPVLRDRVVQTAAKLILETIFEADFEVINHQKTKVGITTCGRS